MQKREYCELILDDREMKGPSYFYDLSINYFGDKVLLRILSEIPSNDKKKAKPWSYNPWQKTIGLLGKAGWELDTAQYRHASSYYMAGGRLEYYKIIAYFKRPVQPERRIDEPRLVLE